MWFERWRLVAPLRWRSLLRRTLVERDLDDELQFHLERQAELLIERGVDPEEAWRTVRRNFGGLTQAREECRDARGLAFLDSLAQDVRYAWRTLRRNPGFTAVAVATLALGIGANAAVFTLIDGLLLARLPYAAPAELVAVTGTYPNGAFAAFRQDARTMDAAAYADGHWFTIGGDGEPERVAGTRISAEIFAILGVQPAHGRWLRPGEDEAPRDRVVAISHALWTRRFRADPGVVGRFIQVDGLPREVVAVMPASFQFPSIRTDVWVPLGLDPRNTVGHWAGDFMPVIGRLRDDATIAQARDEVRRFQARIPGQFPWRMPDSWNAEVSVEPLDRFLAAPVRPRLLMLGSAVLVVLLIACANVANLSLSKAVSRGREVGIRTAIGAEPARIARQLLTESLVLALIGSLAAVAVAYEGLELVARVLPPDTPGLADLRLNWRVLAFTGGLAIVTGCLSGLAPVLHVLRRQLRPALEVGARGGEAAPARRWRAALTVAQVAGAVMLATAAALLVRSLWVLSRTPPGFRADHVVTLRLSPSESVCSTDDRCLAFYRTLMERIDAAGVADAAIVNAPPLSGTIAKRSLEIEEFTVPSGETAPLFSLSAVSPAYFRVMDVRLVAGRGFTDGDAAGAPVAIVSASTARRFWPGRDPIGTHVRFVGERHWHTIVGVAADVRGVDLARELPSFVAGSVYVPHGPRATQENGRVPTDMTLVVRTGLPGPRVRSIVREQTNGLNVLVGDARRMDALVADAIAAPAATAALLSAFAGLALALGCIGVYGVLSFLVSRQMRELGIRLALGAQRRDLFWFVIREGATLSGAGVVIGLSGALATTRWLAGELYGVTPTDPLTFAAVAAAVSAVSLVACYVPTHRAMNVDPLIVLREP